MDHNKLIEESEKIFNDALKEGSGGEQKQLQNPATNPVLKRLESKLKRKQREGDKRAAKLKEAVSNSGIQLQRVYKAGELAGSGKFSGEKEGGEVQDQLDRIRGKARKLSLKDPKIKPKLRRKLRTPSQGVGDVATEKALVKGITKGKAINRAIRQRK